MSKKAPTRRASLERKSNTTATFNSAFYRAGDAVLSGYIYDPSDVHRRFTVEVLLDGHPFRVTRADIFMRELSESNFGDACYGFCFIIPSTLLDANHLV